MKFYYLFIFIIIYNLFHISCNNRNIQKISFSEIIQPPFNNSLTNSTELLDTNIMITILDGNNDKDYKDFNNEKNYSGDTSDYINIVYKPFFQSGSCPLKKETTISINKIVYIFYFDTISLTGELKQKTIDTNKIVDILIFDSLFNIPIFNSDKNTTLNDVLRSINSKFTYVSFWASFCEPCFKDILFYDMYPDSINTDLITIVHLSMYSDFDNSIKIINNLKNASNFYFCDNEYMKKLNCNGFPTGLLLNSDKEYVRHFNYANYRRIIEYLNAINN